MNSFDLDSDNPESEPDLDAESLGSFNPTMGVESSLGSLDQHEANLSFTNKSHKNNGNRDQLRQLDPTKTRWPRGDADRHSLGSKLDAQKAKEESEL